MDEQGFDEDTPGKELLNGNNDFLAELEGCNLVGEAETDELALAVGVGAVCLGCGNLAFNGGK